MHGTYRSRLSDLVADGLPQHFKPRDTKEAWHDAHRNAETHPRYEW